MGGVITPPSPDRERSRLAPIQGARVVGNTSLRLQIAQPHMPHLLGTNQHQGGHVYPPVLGRGCDSSLSEFSIGIEARISLSRPPCAPKGVLHLPSAYCLVNKPAPRHLLPSPRPCFVSVFWSSAISRGSSVFGPFVLVSHDRMFFSRFEDRSALVRTRTRCFYLSF